MNTGHVKLQWNDWRQRWVTLEQGVASRQLPAAESTRRHTELIRASLINMPWLSENMGIMRALGSGYLSQGYLPPEGRAALQALQKRALDVQGEMFRNLKKASEANPGLKTLLTKCQHGGGAGGGD